MKRLAVIFALLIVGCTQPAPQPSPSPSVSPSVNPSPTQAPPACSNPPPVYHPARLHLISPCQEFRGTVVAVLGEHDGDSHIWAAPDPGYVSLLNAANLYHGRPALVLEIVPACTSEPADSAAASHCPASHVKAPVVGDHIDAFGPWVLDAVHGWNELHPVTALTVIP